MSKDGEPPIRRPAAAFRVEGRVGRSAHPDCCTGRGIRWLGFGGKSGNTLVQRQHGLRRLAQAAHRDLPLFGLASADHEQDRHLGEGVLPDLVADLLVPEVEFGAEAGPHERGVHRPGVFVGVAGDRGDDDLAACDSRIV